MPVLSNLIRSKMESITVKKLIFFQGYAATVAKLEALLLIMFVAWAEVFAILLLLFCSPKKKMLVEVAEVDYGALWQSFVLQAANKGVAAKIGAERAKGEMNRAESIERQVQSYREEKTNRIKHAETFESVAQEAAEQGKRLCGKGMFDAINPFTKRKKRVAELAKIDEEVRAKSLESVKSLYEKTKFLYKVKAFHDFAQGIKIVYKDEVVKMFVKKTMEPVEPMVPEGQFADLVSEYLNGYPSRKLKDDVSESGDSGLGDSIEDLTYDLCDAALKEEVDVQTPSSAKPNYDIVSANVETEIDWTNKATD